MTTAQQGRQIERDFNNWCLKNGMYGRDAEWAWDEFEDGSTLDEILSKMAKAEELASEPRRDI